MKNPIGVFHFEISIRYFLLYSRLTYSLMFLKDLTFTSQSQKIKATHDIIDITIG